MIRLGPTTPSSFATRPAGEQDPEVRPKNSGNIYIGVGGWTFEPWRGVFYPDGLTQTKELAYMSRRVTAIEINATYYGSQKPESFRNWARRGARWVRVHGQGLALLHQPARAGGGEFRPPLLRAGVTELGDRLGPVLWQFAPTKQFETADFGLPGAAARQRGRAARCAMWSRCATTASARPSSSPCCGIAVPVVYAEHGTYPGIADVTGDFVYARLQTGSDEIETGYPPTSLDPWADGCRPGPTAAAPDDLARVDPPDPAERPRATSSPS